MAAEDKLRTELEYKFILFDTNILIEASKHFESFEVLLIMLRESKCKVCYFPLIEFEFTRDAYLPTLNEERERFSRKIDGINLPIHPQVFTDALEIAKVYAHQKISPKQISLVDCFIAAYMKKYSDKLFLITKDHKDFPLSIFNRLHIFAFNAGDDVLAPAIYQFNIQKWENCYSDYMKAQTSIS
jgi:predicted nucleic acid-binding protein